MTRFTRPPPAEFAGLGLSVVAGGEVDEYRLTLRVAGDALVPDEISRLLGVQPTTSYRLGDLIGARREGGPRARTGCWHLTPEVEPGAAFDDLVMRLLGRLPSNLDTWARIRANHTIDLFCGVFLRNWNRGMTISPAVMQELSRRGIELGLDIYAPDDASRVVQSDALR